MLVEAAHILNRTTISHINLNQAEELLNSFVHEFEENYGTVNMVYNVHLLLHTADCVRDNGPLFCYSNYSFEDYIGHLKKYVRGPTDVASQITERYLLEKTLQTHLNESEIARNFQQEIEHKQFAMVSKLGGSLLIGKGKRINHEADLNILRDFHFNNIEEIRSYRAVYLNSKMYFEAATPRSLGKRTDDTFLCNINENIFGEIKYILVSQQEIFFLVNNKYCIKPDAQRQISFVELLEQPEQFRVLPASEVITKHALIKTNDIVICSEFPNLFERN